MSDKVIEVSGFGYKDLVNFEEFIYSVVQEETVALEEAKRLIDGEEIIEVNADQPEYYQEFRLINKDALIEQIKERGLDLEN